MAGPVTRLAAIIIRKEKKNGMEAEKKKGLERKSKRNSKVSVVLGKET